MGKLSEFDIAGPRDFFLVRGTEFEIFGPNCPKMALFGPKLSENGMGEILGLKGA